jgi:hypothetical protein
MPSLWHAGDEADHSRAIEARDAVRAYVRSARVTNWFSIEHHHDGGASRRPWLHDEVHLARYKRNDDLAAALLEFDVLAVGTPITIDRRTSLKRPARDIPSHRLVVFLPNIPGSVQKSSRPACRQEC